ncbi:protein furry [Sarcoptes scabiei]|nr:protein furry [Sarcoptes scabiei]
MNTINKSRLQNNEPLMRLTTACKFLMARKFDLLRSLELYKSHESVRFREGLIKFDPSKDPLKRELETGKFTILLKPDKTGSMIALFSAGKHIPQETSHQTTLQGVVYQLDVALDDPRAQKSGIIFIYNMFGSKYSNFDYELSHKILNLLKGAYPARLKKVLILSAPIWFKTPFKILQFFIRDKLRDRVHMINTTQLSQYISNELIPQELGGTYQIDHQKWLEHCLQVHQNDMGDLCPSLPSDKTLFPTPPSSNASSVNSSPSGTMKNKIKNFKNLIDLNNSDNFPTPPLINGCTTTITAIEQNLKSPSPIGSPIDIQSTLEIYEKIEDDIEGIPLEEFLQHLNRKKRKGMFEEYFEIKLQPPVGTFEIARYKANQTKNRYVDVLSYDHSRVKLPVIDNDPNSDYINANYVDGYRQKRAFISTQGPLTKTFVDFWRCVWYNKSIVIVMTTRTMERSRAKCCQYWPSDEKSSAKYGNFAVINNHVEQDKDWIISNLTLVNNETEESRSVVHMQFTSWPDFGVPQSAIAMLEFRQKVRDYQQQLLPTIEWKGHPLGPPIIAHCSAGIGRTGTFITIDISIQRLEDRGRIDIKKTVEKIRLQRAYSIQMPDQYVFCCLAVLEYAIWKGLLENVDLSKFEEDSDHSDSDD